MHTASLELCQKLYELSGWEISQWWHKGSEVNGGNYVSYWDGDRHTKKLVVCPAYDLDYLLRKLPSSYVLMWHDFEDITLEDGEVLKQGRSYVISKMTDDMCECEEDFWNADQYDLPEDAVCKLAIELFKQGILKA